MRIRPEPQEWYFFKAGSDAGLKAGPFSWEGLLQQAEKGTLEPTDVVWDPTAGWQTAAKVSGLFSREETAAVMNGGLKTVPPPPREGGGRRWLTLRVAAGIALLLLGTGLGVYFGAFHDRDGEAVASESTSTTQSTVLSTTTTSPISSTTTESSVVSTTTTPSTTTTVSEDGAGDETPAVLLGKSESGHEVFLHPGERVRVELKPYVGDRVKEVRWNYSPSEPDAVTEVESGVDVISGIVVGCWLELEAMSSGPVTVRAEYVYPNGTSRATWVIYLFVID